MQVLLRCIAFQNGGFHAGVGPFFKLVYLLKQIRYNRIALQYTEFGCTKPAVSCLAACNAAILLFVSYLTYM